MERTTVSRRLKNLEKYLGTTLLIRTPTQMTATKAGRRCFQKCVKILEIVDGVGNAARIADDYADAAPISVAAPADIVESYLQPKLLAYEKAHPKTSIRRRLLPVAGNSDERIEADLTVNWRMATKIDATVRKLASIEQSVYASPSFVESSGCPSHPEELRDLNCVVVGSNSDSETWTFSRHGRIHDIKVRRHFGAASLLEAREAAIAGLGCCQVPDAIGDSFVRSGRLVKILSAFKTDRRILVTATPKRERTCPNVTLLRLFLEEAFLSTGVQPEDARKPGRLSVGA